MKIHSKNFRVREGDEVNLRKWQTSVDPVYKSKDQYKKMLDDHVVKLSLTGVALGAAGKADGTNDGMLEGEV